MKKFFCLLLFVLPLLQLAQAQPAVDDLVKEWERAKMYTREYLDAMPEAGYSLKPTPDMRTFTQQMLHLTDAHFVLAAVITGAKSPVAFGDSEKTGDQSKNQVTKLVMAGYDFVIDNLKKLTPTQLTENVKIFGRFDMSKASAMGKLFEHQTHHRGQTTVYLRLAGVTPPAEKLF